MAESPPRTWRFCDSPGSPAGGPRRPARKLCGVRRGTPGTSMESTGRRERRSAEGARARVRSLRPYRGTDSPPATGTVSGRYRRSTHIRGRIEVPTRSRLTSTVTTHHKLILTSIAGRTSPPGARGVERAAFCAIRAGAGHVPDRYIPSRTSHLAPESALAQASDLAGCCESHCDNHDASHTRGALRSSIVALATLSNQRFACLRSLGMALKPLAYESPRLKHAH